eukprot:95788-Prymnesium_polylepis.1
MPLSLAGNGLRARPVGRARLRPGHRTRRYDRSNESRVDRMPTRRLTSTPARPARSPTALLAPVWCRDVNRWSKVSRQCAKLQESCQYE